MKLKRFNESVDEDSTYIDILYDKIKTDNKIINGFEFYVDYGSGAFTWGNHDFYVYATPYWEDEQFLPISVSNFDGDEIYDRQIKLKVLNSKKSVDNFINYYYEIINSLTLDLNKISELYEVIPILTNKYNRIKIDNLTITSIEDIKESNFDEVIKIYDFLIEKYPELFLTSKYNI